jgi:hypothetical protein
VLYEKGVGDESPLEISVLSQLIVDDISRGGVPVFSRPDLNPKEQSDSVIPIDPPSPILPAKIFLSPMCILPDKKVPQVKTTEFA